MSIVIACRQGETYALGADAQWTDPDGSRRIHGWPKAHQLPGRWLLGVAGSQGLAQDLVEILQTSRIDPGLAEGVRALRKAHRELVKRHQPPADHGGPWLQVQAVLCEPGGILVMSCDGGVETHSGRAAVGTGADLGMGAIVGWLSALPLADPRRDAATCVHVALEAASRYRADCKGEQILKGKPRGEKKPCE